MEPVLDVDAEWRNNTQDLTTVVNAEIAQCTGCGQIGRNLREPLCGMCKQLAAPTPLPIPTPTISQSGTMSNAVANSMSTNFTASMQAAKQKQAQMNAISTPAALSPASEMSAFWAGQSGSGRTILIHARLATPEKPLVTFPNDIMTFDANDSVSDVKKIFVDRFNAQWRNSAPGSMQYDEVNLRWPQNVALIGNTEHGTVGNLYDVHLAMDGFPLKNLVSLADQTKKNPSPRQTNGQHIHLWLIVDAPKMETRLGVELPQALGGSARAKRRLDDSEAGSMPSKRNAPLVSSYGKKGSAVLKIKSCTRFPSSTTMKLRIAQIQEQEEGEIDVDWDGGLTKTVFPGLIRVSEQMVFKRMSNPYNMHYDSWALESELRILHRGKFFWDIFKQVCEQDGVDYCKDFSFTDAYLAEEIVEKDTPSTLSGVTADRYMQEMYEPESADLEPLRVIWLIEPRHTTEVTKYSGTMTQVKRNTLPFVTMAAFAHFSLFWSHGKMVFVDLQGSPTEHGQVLFDAMTHTREGDSGPSDHGYEGLEEFIKNHTDNRICTEIGMKELMIEKEKHRSKPTTSQRTKRSRRFATQSGESENEDEA
ncbi:hypothetical protein D9758_018823 [Tetrapyrgos nigripes]|uniref:Alpha-type protein kinase domain-containing protein n=1 Tax=Tetrapyrgos nigripes TaxID=182062 RepID=A0A8H5F0B8_9AGAR|nr:hypothetical protein D9758_018823 [Tetrapyrgos nigripes]